MPTQLGRFNSETLQVPAKSPSNGRVTNGLIRGKKLARALPFRNGLEIKSLESGGILNITKYLLSNSTGHTELDDCKITTSTTTELVILASQNLNNHEAFFKGNITSSNSRHIVNWQKIKHT